MAQSYKILGQIKPTENTLSNVYVVPSANSAIISTIYITNQEDANANVDIIVRPINEALGNKHYLLKEQLVERADTLVLNLNITMNSNTILAANNSRRSGITKSCNVSFNAFGVEIS